MKEIMFLKKIYFTQKRTINLVDIELKRKARPNEVMTKSSTLEAEKDIDSY